MKILAHRGICLNGKKENTLNSLFKGLDEGFGVETDIRDFNGQLVISHDIPTNDSAIPLERLLRYYSDGKFTSILGINIKSNGLHSQLHRELHDHNIKQYFVFDMSVPDTLGYLKMGMTTFIRQSDVESHPEMVPLTQGIWLDELIKPWINAKVILGQTATTNSLCIVSPELHRREHKRQWSQIEKALDLGCPEKKLMICTDYPHEAKRIFK